MKVLMFINWIRQIIIRDKIAIMFILILLLFTLFCVEYTYLARLSSKVRDLQQLLGK